MVGSRPEVSPGAYDVRKSAAPQTRLLSLDVFRGLTIASMMLVNNSGRDAYAPLHHAQWHGWTFTDMVFPFFLWICGVSMTFSFARRVEEGADRGRLLLHTLRRAAIIFALGLFLNGFPSYHLATLRIPGVLQRIAICYLVAGIVLLYCSRRMQGIAILACLLGYWALLSWVPVPGYGAGVLERQGNLQQYIDGMFLTGHMYSGTKTYDPEGIVSTIPAVATILFGVMTGHLLRSPLGTLEKLVWIFFSGNVLIFLGVFWDKVLPINKNLWTSSYAVFMAGLALAVFGCCYWIIDVKGWKRWCRPFAIYGSNAIAVYVIAGLHSRLIGMFQLQPPIYNALLQLLSPPNAALAYAMLHVLLLYLVAWGLYRKGWFLRI
ncbi:MAG TPA: DUF5009 domain-containing protein [Bryobacteraceae bacterium]|nr:DUF5009 domain-containing protein [Bryobacteraceae bacterium]